MELIVKMIEWVFEPLTWVNPDLPLFFIVFGIPAILVFWIDSPSGKKFTLFIRIAIKYGLVLSRNILNTAIGKNNFSYRKNLTQYRQVIKRRMSELG